MKSCDQLSGHLVIRKGDRNVENNTNSGCPVTQSHPIAVSDLSELFRIVVEKEENPDHSVWDTDVM